MSQFLTFTILGLSTAAIYAVASSGLVVTYNTSGIFNFSHGAIGMFCAFLYWQLSRGWGWPTPIALVVVVFIFAPALGAVIERVVFRGVEGASEVTKLVVSVSLLVFFVALANWIWPPQGRPFDFFFSGNKFQVGEVFVTWHQMITLFVAVAVAVGLRILFRATRIGIAMRAVVDDRALLTLNGGRPGRASMFSWSIGASLAAIAGILIAPSLQLSVIPLTLLVVNAYAAAVIGRLRSLPLTFLGAVILGLAESYGVGYLPTDVPWVSGIRPAIPIIVLFIALLVLPQARLRGHTIQRSREFFPMPSFKAALAGGAVLVGVAFTVGSLLSDTNASTLARGLGLAIIGLSLIPLVGYGAQISLCQMSFAAIGALSMSHLASSGSPIGLVYAFLIAAFVGALIALPALRLQGIYLALATAAFAVMLDRWIFQLRGVEIFGNKIELFPGGSAKVPYLNLFGHTFSSPQEQMVLMAVAFSMVALVVVAIRRGPFGRRLLALRDSPAACATIGMNLTTTKLAVFSLSAGLAGLGGALYGGLLGSANSDQFAFLQSAPLLMVTVVGGIGAVSGALFGGMFFGGIGLLTTAIPSLKNLFNIAPGSVGVSLGRNPNGAMADISASFAAFRRSMRTMIGVGVVLLVVWFLTWKEILFSNWAFAIIAVVLVALSPQIALLVDREHAQSDEDRAKKLAVADLVIPEEGPIVPLEYVGIDRPFTEQDLEALDVALGMSEVGISGAARS